MSKITHERLLDVLKYDPETGLFVWAKWMSSRAPAGAVAGSTYSTGYRMVTIDWQDYSQHRLAWFYVHGEWPKANIDHINGDRTDNRIANLRDVPQSMNSQNQRRPHSDAGEGRLMGTCRIRSSGKWQASIRLNKRTIFLGNFASAEEAHAAYVGAKRELHPGCTI